MAYTRLDYFEYAITQLSQRKSVLPRIRYLLEDVLATSKLYDAASDTDQTIATLRARIEKLEAIAAEARDMVGSGDGSFKRWQRLELLLRDLDSTEGSA